MNEYFDCCKHVVSLSFISTVQAQQVNVIEVRLFFRKVVGIWTRRWTLKAKVNVLKELIDVRDQLSDCNMLSMEDSQ